MDRTEHPDRGHPGLDAPMHARVAYARIVAALAGVDGELHRHEIAHVRTLCAELALSPDQVEQVLAARAQAVELREDLADLADSALRFQVVRDMITLGYADGRYDAAERRQVRGLAAFMLVSEHEVRDLEDAWLVERDRARAADARAQGSRFDGVRRLYRRLTGQG